MCVIGVKFQVGDIVKVREDLKFRQRYRMEHRGSEISASATANHVSLKGQTKVIKKVVTSHSSQIGLSIAHYATSDGLLWTDEMFDEDVNA